MLMVISEAIEGVGVAGVIVGIKMRAGSVHNAVSLISMAMKMMWTKVN